MSTRIDSFLELAVKQGGSDLHLVSGQPPRIRINGILHRVRFRDLSTEDLNRILSEFMDEAQGQIFQDRLAVDFAYEVPDLSRFRVNVYRHDLGIAAAFRVIPTKVPELDTLGLPDTIRVAATQPSGLTLVTGPTGSGKSTTMAAIVDYINRNRKGHIITVEDPIEFIHEFKQCAVTQREIGPHSPNFSEALRNAVREDPDLIMVGELRDLETISLALTASETGIQVLGTLHTNGATRTVDRIINVFPAGRQEQIRTMLSESLRMVVSQQLVRKLDGTGRLLAADILINTHAAAAIIRSGQSHKLESVIQAGGRAGMQSLDGALKDMVRKKLISGEEAYERAVEKSQFERMVSLEREEAA